MVAMTRANARMDTLAENAATDWFRMVLERACPDRLQPEAAVAEAGAMDAPAPDLAAVARIAWDACGGHALWADEFLSPKPSPEFLVVFRAAVPQMVPAPAPLAMPEQNLDRAPELAAMAPMERRAPGRPIGERLRFARLALSRFGLNRFGISRLVAREHAGAESVAPRRRNSRIPTVRLDERPRGFGLPNPE